LLDESTCLVTIRDVGVNGPRARFPRHLRGLVLPRAVAERDVRARPRELEHDRASNSTRAAGDERLLPLEGAELCHYLAESVSSSLSRAAGVLTEIVLTLRSIRLTSPERTLPGPTSTNVCTPSLASACAACVKRTGAVSCSTSS